MKKVLKETCYLILVPTYNRYGARELSGFKVDRVMQRLPKNSAHAICLDLEIPAEVFEPSKITAKVKVEKEEIQVAVKPKRMPKRKGTTWEV